jgi:hypothetical protein
MRKPFTLIFLAPSWERIEVRGNVPPSSFLLPPGEENRGGFAL